jgi:hypothetical protein
LIPVAFHEKVRPPAVYATVERKVVVRPASREVGETPAVYGMRAERVVVELATVHRVREPAVYATRVNRFLVRPARVYFEDVPAVIKTVRERVKVSDGGYRWERRLWERRLSLFGGAPQSIGPLSATSSSSRPVACVMSAQRCTRMSQSAFWSARRAPARFIRRP